MKRSLAATAMVALLPVGCLDTGDGRSLAPPESTTASPAEGEAAFAAWGQYKAAVLDADGKAGADLLSRGTVEHFAGLLDAVLHADAAELEKLPMLDIASVLLARFEFDVGTLQALDGRGFLELALAHGLVGEQSVAELAFARAEVVGDTARLVASAEGQALRSLDMRREEGRWKVHLVTLLRELSRRFDRQTEDRGISHTQAALELVRRTRPDAGEQLLTPLAPTG